MLDNSTPQKVPNLLASALTAQLQKRHTVLRGLLCCSDAMAGQHSQESVLHLHAWSTSCPRCTCGSSGASPFLQITEAPCWDQTFCIALQDRSELQAALVDRVALRLPY